MDNQLLQSIASHISQNEKSTSYPYLDNTGRITAGVGQNVDNWNSFKQLGFINSNTKQPASEAEKQSGYDALTAVKPTMTGKPAEAFQNTTTLKLPDSEQSKLLTDRIRSDEPKVRAALGTDADGNSVYDKLTDGQKAVMHDIQFSTKGGLNTYPNLIRAAKDGTLEQHYQEVDGVSGGNRNWDRITNNRAAILGITPEQAKPGVAQYYQNDKKLPNDYKSLLPAAGKTSDSGDGTATQTATDGEPTAPQDPQTASAQSGGNDQTSQSPPPPPAPTQTANDDPPPVDDATAQQLAQAPDMPPDGTPLDQTFADITGDTSPTQFAAMGTALNQMGNPGADNSSAFSQWANAQDGTGPASTLLAGNSTQDVMDQAATVPADATPSTFAQDLTGDDTPLQFAAMGSALSEMGGNAPDPTLLGGDTGSAAA